MKTESKDRHEDSVQRCSSDFETATKQNGGGDQFRRAASPTGQFTSRQLRTWSSGLNAGAVIA